MLSTNSIPSGVPQNLFAYGLSEVAAKASPGLVTLASGYVIVAADLVISALVSTLFLAFWPLPAKA